MASLPAGAALLSARSGRVRAARRLARRTSRADQRLFLAEGPQAVREALEVPGCVREVFAVPAAASSHPRLHAAAMAAGARWLLVDDAALSSLTGTVHPQGLVAVCRFLDRRLDDVLASTPVLLAVCADVRDPGNAGTVIRCADAAGAGGVVLTGDCVDPYNGKAVRASAGSLFHLPLAVDPRTTDVLDAVRRTRLQVLAADGRGELDLDEAEDRGLLAAPTAWLFGNEAWGLPAEAAALADHRVRIPIHGRAESLNLANAAAVCLYASARVQRRGADLGGGGTRGIILGRVAGGTEGRPVAGDALDLLADGVVVADGTGTVTAMNLAARRLIGVDRGVGRHLSDVVLLQDRTGNSWFGCTDPYRGLATRRRLSEQAWYLPDGTELLVTGSIVRDSPRHPVSQVALSLRSARARERLDRDRSDLVATVAHELRSPLTGVKGFAATLLSKWDKLTDAQKKMMLETVNADADRLTRLIAELLDVARIDTGRLSLFPRPLDFQDAVDRVVASVRAGTGREIAFDVEGDLPQVTADPDKLAQVVTNVVDNAIRHGEGPVRLTAAPIAGEAPYHGVVLHVDDEGEGISPDIRSRVFTKFWKHGQRGGSGLGMYIIHGLVSAHGGSVEIHESPAGGARVTLLWPERQRPE